MPTLSADRDTPTTGPRSHEDHAPHGSRRGPVEFDGTAAVQRVTRGARLARAALGTHPRGSHHVW